MSDKSEIQKLTEEIKELRKEIAELKRSKGAESSSRSQSSGDPDDYYKYPALRTDVGARADTYMVKPGEEDHGDPDDYYKYPKTYGPRD